MRDVDELERLRRRIERYMALPALSAIQRHRLQRAEVAYEALVMRLALRGEVNWELQMGSR